MREWIGGHLGPKVIPMRWSEHMASCKDIESSLVARTIKYGDKEQPCRIPLLLWKLPYDWPLMITKNVGAAMQACTKFMKWSCNPLREKNEVPFNSIKSFGQINFNHEGRVVPRLKVERVSCFFNRNDIVVHPSTFYKSLSTLMNITRKMRFKPISLRFSNNLIDHITQSNRPKILKNVGC